LGAALVGATLALAPPVVAAEPRYDVPAGFTKCPRAKAWNGFFKWASVYRTTCRRAARFMRAYAAEAAAGDMPTRVGYFRCRLRFWRNADGDIYASRHRCERGTVVIRFYGMV